MGEALALYLNNAATSWPKPDCVVDAVINFMTKGGANLARGTASARDLQSLNAALDCRVRLVKLFNGYDGDPQLVTFTCNITESLNIILNGYLKPGMKVLTSAMEHNAVMRPLRALEADGVGVSIIPADKTGVIDLDALANLLANNKFNLLVMAHASNVCGTIQPIEKVAALCRDYNLPFVLDTAQTAGVLPVNIQALGLAACCFTGHKSLLGPQGTGGILWRRDFAGRVKPIITGGTGSFSHLETQPDVLPDKFESGTPNMPGLVGLNASLEWLEATGINKIAQRERELGEYFLERLNGVPDVELAGLTSMAGRLPVFAINIAGLDNGVIADRLALAGIETRPGLHCSPIAHKTLGTFPAGALRVSLGYFNQEGELDEFFDTLKRVISELR